MNRATPGNRTWLELAEIVQSSVHSPFTHLRRRNAHTHVASRVWVVNTDDSYVYAFSLVQPRMAAGARALESNRGDLLVGLIAGYEKDASVWRARRT